MCHDRANSFFYFVVVFFLSALTRIIVHTLPIYLHPYNIRTHDRIPAKNIWQYCHFFFFCSLSLSLDWKSPRQIPSACHFLSNSNKCVCFCVLVWKVIWYFSNTNEGQHCRNSFYFIFSACFFFFFFFLFVHLLLFLLPFHGKHERVRICITI